MNDALVVKVTYWEILAVHLTGLKMEMREGLQ